MQADHPECTLEFVPEIAAKHVVPQECAAGVTGEHGPEVVVEAVGDDRKHGRKHAITVSCENVQDGIHVGLELGKKLFCAWLCSCMSVCVSKAAGMLEKRAHR